MAQLPRDSDSFAVQIYKFDLTRTCPKCLIVGKTVNLKLSQINFSEGMYLCAEEHCDFPLSESNVESYIVQRPLSQLKPRLRKRKRSSFNPRAIQPKEKDSANKFVAYACDTMSQLERFLNNSCDTSMLAIEDQQSPQFFNLDAPHSSNSREWNGSPSSVDMTHVFDGLDSVFMNVTDKDLEQNTFDPYEKKEVSNCAASGLMQTSSVDLTNGPSFIPSLESTKIVSNTVSLPQLQIENNEFCSLSTVPVPHSQNDANSSFLKALITCIVNSLPIRTFLDVKLNASTKSSNIFYRLCCVHDRMQELSNNASENSSVTLHSASTQQSHQTIYNNITKEIENMLRGTDPSFHDMLSTFLSLDPDLRELYLSQKSSLSEKTAVNVPVLEDITNQSNTTSKQPETFVEKLATDKLVLDSKKKSCDKPKKKKACDKGNCITEDETSELEDRNTPTVDLTADDIEMLSVACEELKSSPPSPVSPDDDFVVADVKPIVPFQIAVRGPKRRMTNLYSNIKNSICVKQETYNRAIYSDENSVTTYKPPAVMKDDLKSFNAFQPNSWPRAKVPPKKLQLSSYRKDDLKRICSAWNQKSFLSLASPMPQFRLKAISNGSLPSPEGTDSLPDLDLFSNSSEPSDIFAELDILSNCSA